MSHLRKFANQAAYEAATLSKPAVSLIEDTGVVIYDIATASLYWIATATWDASGVWRTE